MMIGSHNDAIIYAAGLAVTIGMAGDILANGQLTWRWPVLASLFLAGFWYSYRR